MYGMSMKYYVKRENTWPHPNQMNPSYCILQTFEKALDFAFEISSTGGWDIIEMGDYIPEHPIVDIPKWAHVNLISFVPRFRWTKETGHWWTVGSYGP